MNLIKEIILKIWKYLPSYVEKFCTIIIQPKKFVSEKIDFTSESFQQEGLLFAAMSFALSITLYATTAVFPFMAKRELTVELKYLIVQCIIILFLFLSFSLFLYISWRVVGGRAEFKKMFTIYCYYFGVLLPIFVIVQLLTEGLVLFLNNAFYLKWLNFKILILNGNFNVLSKEPSYYFNFLLVYILPSFIIGFIWAVIGWGAYRTINNRSRYESFAAFMLAAILGLIVFSLHFLLQLHIVHWIINPDGREIVQTTMKHN